MIGNVSISNKVRDRMFGLRVNAMFNIIKRLSFEQNISPGYG